MSGRNKGIQSGGAFWWFFQRISGAFLLFALLVHFWVMHFFPANDGVITFDSVMLRLQSPIWKGFDLLFLVFATYHALNGVMMVVNDYVKNDRWRVFLTGLGWVGSAYLIVLGTISIVSL